MNFKVLGDDRLEYLAKLKVWLLIEVDLKILLQLGLVTRLSSYDASFLAYIIFRKGKLLMQRIYKHLFSYRVR